MRKLYRNLLCTFCLFILASAAVPAIADENPLGGLDAYIKKGMSDWELPGLAVAVVKGDEIILMKGYGTREIGKELPVNENTIFAIGSTSKAFTSLSVGLLVQDEKISWDDPVIDHMKDFQLYDPWVTREIRVRDLLANRSGLGDATDLLWYGTDFTRDQIVKRLRYAEPVASFRYTYAYRNVMFLVAGQLVSAVTGTSWDNFLEERVFKPLKMTRSSTTTQSLKGMDNVASPHLRIGNKITAVPYRNMDNICPAGGIVSCIRDMAQWLRLHINEGVFEGQRIIDRSVIQETHTQQTPVPMNPAFLAKFPDAHRFDYCLSWVTLDHLGRLMVWHNGSIDGMHAVIGFIPSEKIGAVILSNSEVQDFHEALYLYIIDTLVGVPPRDWSTNYLKTRKTMEEKKAEVKEQLQKSRKKDTHPSLPLDVYTGTYSSKLNGPVRVTLENDRLAIYCSTALVADLEHWHYDTFQGTWRDRSADARMGKPLFTFTLDGKAEVNAVSMDDFVIFERIEVTPEK